MTYFVTENCIQCKFTDCVVACPVDCFHEGPNFLAINPDGCIDCGICVPECPAEAIFSDEDDGVPDRDYWLKKNAELCATWPVIIEARAPLSDATVMNGVAGKKDLLIE
jgi:ferredoxin